MRTAALPATGFPGPSRGKSSAHLASHPADRSSRAAAKAAHPTPPAQPLQTPTRSLTHAAGQATLAANRRFGSRRRQIRNSRWRLLPHRKPRPPHFPASPARRKSIEKRRGRKQERQIPSFRQETQGPASYGLGPLIGPASSGFAALQRSMQIFHSFPALPADPSSDWTQNLLQAKHVPLKEDLLTRPAPPSEILLKCFYLSRVD